MECNRDEAKRAKEIAEIKFSTKDVTGAKKFALKAQNLYPELDGISQLISTLDIYIAAENKINNESDFYAILGVSALADDDTVRKHYRKLALSLHPDKNKSVGADGAFKYISEAWSLLSDRTKRNAYDQRRQITAQNGGTSTAPPAGQNGFYNFTRSTTAGTKGTSTNTKDHKPKTQKTFWTVCHGCKMQYEYLRMYLHQNLLCPNCHEPFLAMETAPPFTKVSTKGFKSQKFKNASNTGKHRSTSQSFQWAPFSKTGSPASSSQAATMVQLAYEKVKREREEAQAAIKREEALKRKKLSRRAHKYSSSGLFNSVKKNPEEIDAVKGVSHIDVQTRLIKKARNEIRRKLHEWRSETGHTTVNHKEQKEEETHVDFVNGKSMKNPIEPLVINVLDPDFHNFDRERCETCFKEGQVWAAYDDDDGMPRHYAMIQQVNSVEPFKMKVRWLNFQTNDEMDLIFGFSKPLGFGEFRTGKHETVVATNCFSHKVNFTKTENGFLQIYPRKGEVWALYRNWSPEWNEETPNEVKHKYDIVDVDEYDEESGFMVTPLVKVAGFKTVFHRQINPKESRVIPESEIFRFSHQIPAHLLTGQEMVNALKGCRELDPAATPVEFLQVIGDFQEPENTDNDDESAVLADLKEVDEEIYVVEESRRM
ncbi:hypothetical protein R6Q59_011995 [Mikania micrantha]|uniref:J domain-containing protein n=1 Tax=Mikania micrantha TaxID=192012 RepID=A0A5N6LNF0_9ASTR|nr:hypothetical protein E3N88_40684 [Mikania micrantha]